MGPPPLPRLAALVPGVAACSPRAGDSAHIAARPKWAPPSDPGSSTYRGVPWKGLNCTGLYWEADSDREGTGKGMVMDCMGMGRGREWGEEGNGIGMTDGGGQKPEPPPVFVFAAVFFYFVFFCFVFGNKP